MITLSQYKNAVANTMAGISAIYENGYGLHVVNNFMTDLTEFNYEVDEDYVTCAKELMSKITPRLSAELTISHRDSQRAA